MDYLLIGLSILPVVVLMIFIYFQDKYQKEPIKLLAKAFIGGMLAIPLDFIVIDLIKMIFYSESTAYQAFLRPAFPKSCRNSSSFSSSFGGARNSTNTWTALFMLLSSDWVLLVSRIFVRFKFGGRGLPNRHFDQFFTRIGFRSRTFPFCRGDGLFLLLGEVRQKASGKKPDSQRNMRCGGSWIVRLSADD